MPEPSRVPASFRDPAGFVFRRDGTLYRQVNHAGRDGFDRLLASGLYERLTGSGRLVAHHDAEVEPFAPAPAYRVIEPEPVPFISYAPEWCFSQLRDAALLTLDIQREAIGHGMSLKDAAASNVQFRAGRPVFLDTLSFEPYREGEPWVAYRQFCQHFLAPLALSSLVDVRLHQLLRTNLDGVPLDLAARLLPARSRLRPGLLMHIHLHARLQRSAAGTPGPAARPARRFGRSAMLGLVESLRSAVNGLRREPPASAWRDYEHENSYSAEGTAQKRRFVADAVDEVRPASCWDLGANTGAYSRLVAARGVRTVALDADPSCVEIAYRRAREEGSDLLPLVMDLANPSPGDGWAGHERLSLAGRGPADLVLALALVHHLAIAGNVPLPEVSRFLAGLGRRLVVEFVPKADPQVRRMLASRVDVFDDYHREGFEAAFAPDFATRRAEVVAGSERVLYLMERR